MLGENCSYQEFVWKKWEAKDFVSCEDLKRKEVKMHCCINTVSFINFFIEKYLENMEI